MKCYFDNMEKYISIKIRVVHLKIAEVIVFRCLVGQIIPNNILRESDILIMFCSCSLLKLFNVM